jgi:hypothetical protein
LFADNNMGVHKELQVQAFRVLPILSSDTRVEELTEYKVGLPFEQGSSTGSDHRDGAFR